ncbi:MAG: hypothetical protein K9M45_04885 [Kiritimatiellales bacterium]|nr:hypothetical protein [Kiritimatiellales bacterium]
MRQLHFIGIGGVGMNGVAQLAALAKHAVSGSDRAYDPESELFQALENLGIRIFPQDGSGITEATDAVVYSTAIESNNPDIQKSNQLGIPLLHRAEMLKELIGDDELIAVAGTAGKSTVTGLLGWIFQCLEKDPSVYNGAAVLNWKQFPTIGNVRKGSSYRWIIEADESDRSFLNFHPTHTVITNISKDHFELDELHRLFDQFKKQTSGLIIDGKTIRGQSSDLSVPMLGKHNLENARCAIHLCDALGMDMDKVREAVASFKGIERRLEIAGETNGITVIDDYAHNPVKIAAALAAVSETAARVHAFWRPHGFTPLFQCLEDLVDAFSNHWKTHSDGSLFILPVYYAGGTVERKVTAAEFVEKLNSAGVPAVYVKDYAALKQRLEQRAQPGDAILGMGARDPELPQFAKRLVSEWKIS